MKYKKWTKTINNENEYSKLERGSDEINFKIKTKNEEKLKNEANKGNEKLTLKQKKTLRKTNTNNIG